MVDEIKQASDQASSLTQQVIRLTEESLEGPRTRSAGRRVSGADSGAGTVLVVITQHSVRILVSEYLSAHGYDVLQASGPETAVELGRSHPGGIDAVLVEMGLPSCSGSELVSRLGEIRGAVPTIYLAELEAQPALGEGDALLRKPLRPSELRATLERLLDRGTLH